MCAEGDQLRRGRDGVAVAGLGGVSLIKWVGSAAQGSFRQVEIDAACGHSDECAGCGDGVDLPVTGHGEEGRRAGAADPRTEAADRIWVHYSFTGSGIGSEHGRE